VHEGKRSEGHARALLALEQAETIVRLARRAVADGWSVREVESRVRVDGPSCQASPGDSAAHPRRGARVEEGAPTPAGDGRRIHPGRKGRGVLAINYYSNDDLARFAGADPGEPFAG
jgi:ParB family chromosome partitioning protein